jgi:hypothetical protein
MGDKRHCKPDTFQPRWGSATNAWLGGIPHCGTVLLTVICGGDLINIYEACALKRANDVTECSESLERGIHRKPPFATP